jgi:hypothetical protein
VLPGHAKYLVDDRRGEVVMRLDSGDPFDGAWFEDRSDELVEDIGTFAIESIRIERSQDGVTEMDEGVFASVSRTENRGVAPEFHVADLFAEGVIEQA